MKVIFHKLFPYAPYLNEYIGAEMDFPDTLDQKVFDSYVNQLREMAENNHKKRYPDLPPSLTDFNTGQTSAPPVIDYKAKERLEIKIDNAQSLNELVKYEAEAIDNGLGEYYLDKLDQLTNKSTIEKNA